MSSYQDRKKEMDKLKSIIENMLTDLDDLITINNVVIETYKLKQIQRKYQLEYWKK